MKYTAAIIAALAARVSAVSEPAAQATPMLTAPQGECQPSVDGPFKLTVVEEKKEKRGLDLEPANCNEGGLILTLADGILKDEASRTGYISGNYQLQFDSPPQSGSLTSDGFALCSDGNLSLKGNTTFYECPTGEDAWNLYDRRWAEHCGPLKLVAKRCGEVASVTGEITVVPTKVITEMEDGQPKVKSTDVGKVVCQIKDGQVRGHVSGCVNTSQVTGTGTGASGVPSATGMVHNHTTSAPVPDGTEDIEDDDSGSAGLAFHASAACVGLAVSYIVIAVL